jgi:hypothetical protein
MKVIGSLLLALTVLILFAVGIGYWSFNRMVAEEVKTLFARSTPPDAADRAVIVTEAMLQDLPAPVQRYLTYAGVVGKPIVRSVRLKQEGRFRTGLDQPWMQIRANEYYTVDDPGFIWDATFYQNGLPILRVRDSYRDGEGHILGKIGGLFTLLEDKGAGVDQGTLLRYLQEMTWFPSAFLNENITFSPIDDHSAQVTLSAHGQQVTGTLLIDDEGKLTNFVAERYRNPQDGYGTWTTPMTEYGEYEGLRLPKAGKGVWLLPEGELEYIDVAATEIEYDLPERY